MKKINALKYILISILISFGTSAFAQTTIKGIVKDAETLEGEVAAIAQLLKEGQSVTYTITDSTGAFLLKTNVTGPLTVIIENMGRKTIERDITAGGSTVDLGELLIENDP